MQRVPWYEDSRWLSPALLSAYFILVLVFLATVIRTGRRIFFRNRSRWSPQPETMWLTWGPRVASILWVVFLGGVAGYFALRGNDTLPPTPEWFPWLVATNWVTGTCLFFSFFAVLGAIGIWYHDELRWITKVKFTLVGAACLLLSVYAVYYHLIGPAHRI
jgi:hypothetical protein